MTGTYENTTLILDSDLLDLKRLGRSLDNYTANGSDSKGYLICTTPNRPFPGQGVKFDREKHYIARFAAGIFTAESFLENIDGKNPAEETILFPLKIEKPHAQGINYVGIPFYATEDEKSVRGNLRQILSEGGYPLIVDRTGIHPATEGYVFGDRIIKGSIGMMDAREYIEGTAPVLGIEDPAELENLHRKTFIVPREYLLGRIPEIAKSRTESAKRDLDLAQEKSKGALSRTREGRKALEKFVEIQRLSEIERMLF